MDDSSTTPAWGRSDEGKGDEATFIVAAQELESDANPISDEPAIDATVRDSFLGARIDNYQVESILGQGGFGTVYKATDTKLGRPVALKVLRNQLEPKHKQLFEREAQAIARLSKHPNIVQIFAWGEYLGHSFFALEYLPLSVLDLVKANRAGLPWTEALPLVIQCAEALGFAHDQGIIHRDIKPPNLLLESEAGPIKIADFGLSRYSDSIDTTITGTVSGSPPYMSPEQASAQPVDHRSDIFSLGVTLYEMLTGKRPFEGNSAGEIINRIVEDNGVPIAERHADLPSEVVKAVEKALAHQRTDRYQSAFEFARDLNNALPESTRVKLHAPVQSSHSPVQARGFAARMKRWHVGAVAIVVLAVALGLWSTLTGGARPSIALASGNRLLESGDAKGAGEAFKAALEDTPSNDLACYGLGYAYLRQGLLDDAENAFGRVKEASLSLEGLAAVACEQAEGDEARTQLVDSLGKAKTAYLQTLLGSLDVNATQYQQAAQTLQGAQAGEFTYQWQKAECLQALGQAYYHLNQFQQSAQVFDSLRGISPSYAEVADRYIQLANNALNEDRRQEVMKKAKEIRELMDSGVAPSEATDEWTSRPFAFAILPGNLANSRVAVKSGMADVLPMLLGDSLVSLAPMTQVDRDLINEVLTEQQLSAQLGSKTNQIQLGKVLGARLLIQCNLIRYDGKEMLRPQIVDTESTLGVDAEMIPVPPQSVLDETANAVAASIWNALKDDYPLQGRLTVKDGQPEINIGSKVGVVQGARFSVLMKPGQVELPNRAVLVDGPVGESFTNVRLEGFSVDDIPSEGWCVRGKLGSRQEGQ